jgi:hypothetical protein
VNHSKNKGRGVRLCQYNCHYNCRCASITTTRPSLHLRQPSLPNLFGLAQNLWGALSAIAPTASE